MLQLTLGFVFGLVALSNVWFITYLFIYYLKNTLTFLSPTPKPHVDAGGALVVLSLCGDAAWRFLSLGLSHLGAVWLGLALVGLVQKGKRFFQLC